jgi:5-enolpyruvylshikimate-3-phosphate synthase
MKAIVHPSKISGHILAPRSKSDMQRACAAALLHKGTTIIHQPGHCNDDLAALDAQVALDTCKQQAVAILNATDWTSIGDVGNPQTANPYLVNQVAFITYRSAIRALAVNPVADPVWPTQPTEQWSS